MTEREFRRRPTGDRPDEPARVVCGRCGLLVETACWHRLCPLTGVRTAR